MKKIFIGFFVTIMFFSQANAGLALSLDTIQDSLVQYQYYLNEIGINEAWYNAQAQNPFEPGSANVIVAVIDSGIYLNHPDLVDNIWHNPGETNGNGKDDDGNGYVDDYYGWDFVANSPEMTVYDGHGTMVAGIIAARANDFGIVGVASNVKLMSLIACTALGCSTSDVNKAIRYAADKGADVINLSLGRQGTYSYLDSSFNDSIDYAYAKGSIIVAAAGNGDIEAGLGKDLGMFPVSPVCNEGGQDKIIGVASTKKGSSSIVYWSNYGGCSQVSAPGEHIVSTAPPKYSTINSFYDIADGTSFSAPIISGIAALIKSRNRSTSNASVINAINNAGVGPALKIYAPRAVQAVDPGFDIVNVIQTQVKPGDEVLLTVINNSSVIDSAKLIGPSVIQLPKSSVRYKSLTQSSLILPKNDMLAGRYAIEMGGAKIYEAFTLTESAPPSASTPYIPTPIYNPPTTPISNISNDTWAETEKQLVTGISQMLVNRLKGRILLQTQEHGEAWYVHPEDGKKYYMKDGAAAYQMLRQFGLGITSVDIAKIPVGLESRFQDQDSDADGLPDKLEEGLKTDPAKADTDNDGVSDGQEILSNSDPLSSGKLLYSTTLINRMKGKILLQVDSKGEAWYVHPVDGKRYYMKNGNAAYQIMRFLSLGISNTDLRKIPVGDL